MEYNKWFEGITTNTFIYDFIASWLKSHIRKWLQNDDLRIYYNSKELREETEEEIIGGMFVIVDIAFTHRDEYVSWVKKIFCIFYDSFIKDVLDKYPPPLKIPTEEEMLEIIDKKGRTG